MSTVRYLVVVVASAFIVTATQLVPAFAADPRVETRGQAPFGGKVADAFVNYNRASPFVGTAGLLGAGGAAKAKALGFRTIVDLRMPSEGIDAEQSEAAAAGIAYVNLPVSAGAPTRVQVEAFAKIADDPAKFPILLHCHAANRAGAMWALYRVQKGVSAEIAIEEGRTAGLQPERESAVRAMLGFAAAKP